MSTRNQFDIRSILSAAPIYSLFRNLISASPWQAEFVQSVLNLEDGNRVLDIGCGPADILQYLPDVEYVGFDMSANYINKAQHRYKERGKFFQQELTDVILDEFDPFNLVLALGIIHHLSDEEAIVLFETARKAMLPDATLVTLDGAYTENQSKTAKKLLDMDRGNFVRSPEQYLQLAKKVFPKVSITVRTDMLRLPYTHCIMQCSI